MMNNGNGFQQHHVRRSKRLQQKHRNDNKLLLQLPEEVLTDEILIRLPAKQLARMRCVSKPFNGYISQPRFIKSHLDRNLVRNNSKDNEILLVINPNTVFTKRVQVTAHPSRSPDIQLNDLIKLPPDFPCPNSEWKVLGSVHGLICFTCGFDYQCFDIYIWNPSLLALMRLPNFTSPSRTHEDLSYKIQFGYDPKSDDYKVVKLMDHCEPEMQVEVYSMRKGTWQFISERFPSRAHPVDCGNKVIAGCHDGHVYRWGISFEFEMWVINEPESWVKVKHSALSHFTCNIKPMGFTPNNEFFLQCW
uniref:putative F-box protein At1g47790 n=1 Tax=Erigeron canadensis TaxID=72917 RepID=UPI001CB97EAA|nr:putative F-box protein At1g47790 [Erigeron canadensis]